MPASIERLSGLVLLNLKDWKNLESLPSTINGLRSLRTLHLFYCTLENVPESLGKVEGRMISTVEQNAVKTVTKSAKAKFAKVLYKIHNSFIRRNTVLLLCAFLSMLFYCNMEDECK